MSKQPCVYIMTNRHHTVLYTGVTSDLPKRVMEHREKLAKGFTANCDTLVYYEVAEDMESAITREKQIKAGLQLIENFNRDWWDLSDTF